jgi:hypothetical protein
MKLFKFYIQKAQSSRDWKLIPVSRRTTERRISHINVDSEEKEYSNSKNRLAFSFAFDDSSLSTIRSVFVPDVSAGVAVKEGTLELGGVVAVKEGTLGLGGVRL